MVKNNPISNIDQSIYSPEFTKEEMDNRIKEMQREKWRQHFLKNARQGETPKRRTHQRPILEPKRIGQKIDTRVPRKDWTIYKEQNTNYGGSLHNQEQPNMMGHQIPHNSVARDQSSRWSKHSNTRWVGTGESLRGGPGDDPSDDPSDPQDPDPGDDPGPNDSGEETDTSEEWGTRKGS